MSGQAVADYGIKELRSSDAKRWDDYVLGSTDGTFFHLSGWQSVIRDTLRKPTYYLYCECGSEVVGVLPLVHMKSILFGNALISMPFLVYGGPVADSAEIADCLVGRAREIAGELGVDYLEFRNRRHSDRGVAVNKIYATFRKPLHPDPERNLKEIPRRQRAMIRKGMKAGLTAERDDDTNRLHAALLECKRNLGTPFFSNRYLRSIKSTFADDAEILTVTRNGETVCSVMSFRFRDEILPYYGGGGTLARACQGNDFMYWAVMEKACVDGVAMFDYGRSRIDTGAYRFKKHWGFEPEPLSYEYFPVRSKEIPELNPGNPKYQLMIKAWKRLPLGLASVMGPPIARRLG
jgi:FemAB-related protein (PEP-CTERM system-associated)